MTLRSQVELKALRRCVVEMVSQDIESGPKMSDPSRATKPTVVSACTGTVSTSHAVHTSTYQTPAGSRNTGSIEVQNLSVEHLILCFVGAKPAKRLHQIKLFLPPRSHSWANWFRYGCQDE
jgi:hypothetical protein